MARYTLLWLAVVKHNKLLVFPVKFNTKHYDILRIWTHELLQGVDCFLCH